MIKRISLLVAAALMAAMMMVATAAPAFAISDADAEEQGCNKVRGQVVCTTKDYPGKSDQASGDPEPGGIATNTKKTQGNLENDSPGPPKTGTSCDGPPGRCK